MSNYRKMKPEFEFCVNSIVLTVAKPNMKKAFGINEIEDYSEVQAS